MFPLGALGSGPERNQLSAAPSPRAGAGAATFPAPAPADLAVVMGTGSAFRAQPENVMLLAAGLWMKPLDTIFRNPGELRSTWAMSVWRLAGPLDEV